jgi:hypothetical protein
LYGNPNISNKKGILRILSRPQKGIINNLALFDAPTNITNQYQNASPNSIGSQIIIIYLSLV